MLFVLMKHAVYFSWKMQRIFGASRRLPIHCILMPDFFSECLVLEIVAVLQAKQLLKRYV